MADDQRHPEGSDAAVQPLDELCEDILVRHHASAHIAVPRIRGHLATVIEHDPGAISPELARAFADLADLLSSHLAKEENILFPAFSSMAEAERAGRDRPPMAFATVLHPIRLMEAEHARLATALEELTRLADGFVPGVGASDRLRRLMAELAIFRDELSEHLRVENDVLFPRALDLDRRL